ncbi:NAD-dependent epimerase/dehydratase family protein [Chitinophaga pinensis]|uniref:NAD-dependent epimerase/dehydratase family protein n=1 Tax=Chitinophaga pinensis TaxID=79329 RepID=UPI001C991E3F|nr:NAD-dependent epimerase/dehydratase family protein [Chitinophaga pinensis]
MNGQRKVALIAGAQGVIGRNLADHLDADGSWDIIGLSRRGGEAGGNIRHIAVDLQDREDTALKLGGLTDVTHIFMPLMQTPLHGQHWCHPIWRC